MQSQNRAAAGDVQEPETTGGAGAAGPGATDAPAPASGSAGVSVGGDIERTGASDRAEQAPEDVASRRERDFALGLSSAEAPEREKLNLNATYTFSRISKDSKRYTVWRVYDSIRKMPAYRNSLPEVTQERAGKTFSSMSLQGLLSPGGESIGVKGVLDLDLSHFGGRSYRHSVHALAIVQAAKRYLKSSSSSGAEKLAGSVNFRPVIFVFLASALYYICRYTTSISEANKGFSALSAFCRELKRNKALYESGRLSTELADLRTEQPEDKKLRVFLEGVSRLAESAKVDRSVTAQPSESMSSFISLTNNFRNVTVQLMTPVLMHLLAVLTQGKCHDDAMLVSTFIEKEYTEASHKLIGAPKTNENKELLTDLSKSFLSTYEAKCKDDPKKRAAYTRLFKRLTYVADHVKIKKSNGAVARQYYVIPTLKESERQEIRDDFATILGVKLNKRSDERGSSESKSDSLNRQVFQPLLQDMPSSALTTMASSSGMELVSGLDSAISSAAYYSDNQEIQSAIFATASLSRVTRQATDQNNKELIERLVQLVECLYHLKNCFLSAQVLNIASEDTGNVTPIIHAGPVGLIAGNLSTAVRKISEVLPDALISDTGACSLIENIHAKGGFISDSLEEVNHSISKALKAPVDNERSNELLNHLIDLLVENQFALQIRCSIEYHRHIIKKLKRNQTLLLGATGETGSLSNNVIDRLSEQVERGEIIDATMQGASPEALARAKTRSVAFSESLRKLKDQGFKWSEIAKIATFAHDQTRRTLIERFAHAPEIKALGSFVKQDYTAEVVFPETSPSTYVCENFLVQDGNDSGYKRFTLLPPPLLSSADDELLDAHQVWKEVYDDYKKRTFSSQKKSNFQELLGLLSQKSWAATLSLRKFDFPCVGKYLEDNPPGAEGHYSVGFLFGLYKAMCSEPESKISEHKRAYESMLAPLFLNDLFGRCESDELAPTDQVCFRNYICSLREQYFSDDNFTDIHNTDLKLYEPQFSVVSNLREQALKCRKHCFDIFCQLLDIKLFVGESASHEEEKLRQSDLQSGMEDLLGKMRQAAKQAHIICDLLRNKDERLNLTFLKGGRREICRFSEVFPSTSENTSYQHFLNVWFGESTNFDQIPQRIQKSISARFFNNTDRAAIKKWLSLGDIASPNIETDSVSELACEVQKIFFKYLAPSFDPETIGHSPDSDSDRGSSAEGAAATAATPPVIVEPADDGVRGPGELRRDSRATSPSGSSGASSFGSAESKEAPVSAGDHQRELAEKDAQLDALRAQIQALQRANAAVQSLLDNANESLAARQVGQSTPARRGISAQSRSVKRGNSSSPESIGDSVSVVVRPQSAAAFAASSIGAVGLTTPQQRHRARAASAVADTVTSAIADQAAEAGLSDDEAFG